jgi:hypothetical protein
MATIPTAAPETDDDGYIPVVGIVTVNATIQAVNKNEPIFGVESSALKGYIAVKMYDQVTGSAIGGESTYVADPDYELYTGDAYSSGKPFVMNETTIAKNVNTA